MRKVLAVAVLALVCAGGCKMCCHPYDDTYPVVHEGAPGYSPMGDYAKGQPSAAGGQNMNAPPPQMARGPSRPSQLAF